MMTLALSFLPLATTANPWLAAAAIGAVVLASTTGEVLTAAAMKSIGDLDMIRARSGMVGAIRAVHHLPVVLRRSIFSGSRVSSRCSSPSITST
jgi:hypothetical protein